MPILEFFVVIMQWHIVKNIFKSTVWKTKRNQVDGIKAMYCCIIFSSVFSILIVITSIISQDVLSINYVTKALFYSSIIFHSFIVNKAVLIYNRTRLGVSMSHDRIGHGDIDGAGDLCPVRVPGVNRGSG